MSRVAVLLFVLEHGPVTAKATAEAVGLSTTDVGRILIAFVARRLLYIAGHTVDRDALYARVPKAPPSPETSPIQIDPLPGARA